MTASEHPMPIAAYRAGLLLPVGAPGAAETNAPLLGPRTLGIEVTEAALAERCGLGVIDPQHGFGRPGARGKVPASTARAAVEAALDWPLPPPGARLVTIRPDADAFGAMAVLCLRAAGVALDEAARGRIELTARCDSFQAGDWAGWVAERGPLPRPAVAEDVSLFPAAYSEAAALAADAGRSPQARLADFMAWIVSGHAPPASRDAAHAFGEALAAAWNAGEITARLARGGRMAVVSGARPGALGLGYRFAPVVTAFAGQTPPRRVTIAQFAPGHADLARLAKALNRLEPGWGGSATIIGSPQGVGSRLPGEAIEAALADALT